MGRDIDIEGRVVVGDLAPDLGDLIAFCRAEASRVAIGVERRRFVGESNSLVADRFTVLVTSFLATG